MSRAELITRYPDFTGAVSPTIQSSEPTDTLGGFLRRSIKDVNRPVEPNPTTPKRRRWNTYATVATVGAPAAAYENLPQIFKTIVDFSHNHPHLPYFGAVAAITLGLFGTIQSVRADNVPQSSQPSQRR